MEREAVIEAIARGHIIAILRGEFGGREVEIAGILLEAGVTAIEVTLNSPGAIRCIKSLAGEFGSRMAVGAGTVLSREEVEKVNDAGARFIVSPNRDFRVIEATRCCNLVSIPGCFTPSEAIEAMGAGADAIKLFPASSLGPSFVRAMRGPLPDIRLVPTGGVTMTTAREYLEAGAWAVGVGSELVGADMPGQNGLDRLRERAKAFVDAIRLRV